MDFKKTLKEYQEIINHELSKQIRSEECIEDTLNRSMKYSLMAGGKRLRPMLVMQTYLVFKQDYTSCLPFAVAIEMVHNFSLIHDDLPAIDNDDFRHGKLTNHKKFNESTAILAGDALLNQAYITISQALTTCKPEDLTMKVRAFEEFSKAVDRMIVGEFVDTELEGKDISDECLKYIHDNKTGALLKVCVRMGAILAGAEENDIEKLTKYAQKIGLAFQIKDDILNEVGDEAIVGKPVGNDKEMGKCTYVTNYGLEKAEAELDRLTKEAVGIAKEYGEKGEFLVALATYIKDRNK